MTVVGIGADNGGLDVGSTVDPVAPGLVKTALLASVPVQARDTIRAKVPLGHLGRPEVARVVRLLAASSGVTGRYRGVDGGLDR